MDNDSARSAASNDPAIAFAELRSEVSLLRRAVEGLTAERRNAPDYTPTLTELAGRLSRVEEFLGKVSESPAMRLTPENLSASIAKASETVRARDRENLGKADAMLRASIASINTVVEQAWTADRQWKQLYRTSVAALAVGAIGAILFVHLL